MALPGRSCGECSMCCKVLGIEALNKPIGTWCPHCAPGRGGCTVYETRPAECRSYECQWLIDKELGDEWKPLISKMALSLLRLNGVLLLDVNVDCDYPNAWKQPPYYEQLKALTGRVGVQVNVGSRHWAVMANDDVEFCKDGGGECTLVEGSGYRMIPEGGGFRIIPIEQADNRRSA